MLYFDYEILKEVSEVTEVEIERVKKIQNGQKSLGWGSHQTDEGVLFVVGHKAYRGKILYFVVRDYDLYLLKEDNSQELVGKSANVDDCIKSIIYLLKEWFPPIGLNEASANTHQSGLASAT